jgi:serralysin
MLTVIDNFGRSSSVEHDVVATAPTAITYYVSNSGDDANSGTSSSPWRTIQRAANTVSAGATVIVIAGTYNERVNVSRSGSSSYPITFQTQGSVLMKGFSISGSYVIVDGFEPSNIAADGYNPAAYAGIFSSGKYNIIRNNYSHNNGSWGVFLETTASFNQVLNNVMAYNGHLGIWVRGSDHLIQKNDISHSIQHPSNWKHPPSWSDADGIAFEGDRHIFRGNYIHDITYADAGQVNPHRDAFQESSNTSSSDVIVDGNLIHIPYHEAWTSQMMMLSGTITNLMVRNNIVYNTDRGPNLYGTIIGMRVENNTFVNITDYAVSITSTGGANDVLVRNNIFRNVRTPAVGINSPATATQDHNFTGDPLFVNEAGLDFHLKSGSPAIDTGLNTPDVTQDYDGISRPQGASTDIGAYEYPNP